jgi:hypothetical protein
VLPAGRARPIDPPGTAGTYDWGQSTNVDDPYSP